MRPRLYSPIGRVGVRPDEPDAVTAPRPRGSRRPHSEAKVAQVRRLIEDTPLTYGEIARRTGVGRASICRWTSDHGWQRHAFAPRATDTVPRARASAKLKRRTLAARLDALAERHIRELEEAACVDPEKLAEALELLKMAKLAARPRHGRRRRQQTPFVPARGTPSRLRDGDPVAGTQESQAQEQAALGSRLRGNERGEDASPTGIHFESPDQPTRPIMQLCAGDVDLHRAPREAIDDFLENREPPPKETLPRRSRSRRRLAGDAYHAWMLEKE